MQSKEIYRNQDFVLKVDANIDPAVLDLNRYEDFLDTLCVGREYQKEAIREVVKFLIGGRYKNTAIWRRKIGIKTRYCKNDTPKTKTFQNTSAFGKIELFA